MRFLTRIRAALSACGCVCQMWPKPQNDPAMRLGSRFSGRLLVVFLLGVGLALGQPPMSLWPLALLSLLAVFWLETHQSLNASLRQAFERGWSLGMGYFTVSMHWIVEPFLVDSAAHGWMAPFALLLFAVFNFFPAYHSCWCRYSFTNFFFF